MGKKPVAPAPSLDPFTSLSRPPSFLGKTVLSNYPATRAGRSFPLPLGVQVRGFCLILPTQACQGQGCRLHTAQECHVCPVDPEDLNIITKIILRMAVKMSSGRMNVTVFQ